MHKKVSLSVKSAHMHKLYRVPSENVSENYRTALQRESRGHIWGRPSEMRDVRQGQEVEI